MDLPDAEWRKRLSPEQYHVLREGGTERAFTGVLYHNHEDGDYRCAACGNELFDSGTKFESGSGWPSFTSPAAADHLGVTRQLADRDGDRDDERHRADQEGVDGHLEAGDHETLEARARTRGFFSGGGHGGVRDRVAESREQAEALRG